MASAGLPSAGVVNVARPLNSQRHAAPLPHQIQSHNRCRTSFFHGERIRAARLSHCKDYAAKPQSLSNRRSVEVRSSAAVGGAAVTQDGAASDAVFRSPHQVEQWPTPSTHCKRKFLVKDESNLSFLNAWCDREPVAGIDQKNPQAPRQLADVDSRFMIFRGVEIHYKRAGPASAEDDAEALREAQQAQNGAFVAEVDPEFPPEEALKFSLDPYESEVEEEEDAKDGAGEEVKEEKLVTPAVLLHGFGASSFSWDRMLKPLAESLCGPVIMFDRPAFGLTSRPKPPPLGEFLKNPEANPYSLAFSTAATLAFEKRLQRETASKPVLIAHSAGCLVAVEAALARPDLVDALVLVAPAIVPPLTASDVSASPSKLPIQAPEAILKPLQSKDAKKKIRMLKMAFSAFLRVAALRVSTWFYQIRQAFAAGAAEVPLRLNSAIQYLQSKTHEGRFLPLNVLDTIASALLLAASALAFVLVQIALFLGSLGSGLAAATHVGSGLKGISTAFSAALLRSKIAIALVRRAMNLGGVAAVRTAWHDQTKFTEDFRDGYTKPLKCLNWDRALLEYMIAFNLNPPTGNKLKDLKCPVLVVTGDTDKIVPVWNAKRVAEAIPGAQFCEIPQCGHLPQEEKPQELLKAVLAFLLGDTPGAKA